MFQQTRSLLVLLTVLLTNPIAAVPRAEAWDGDRVCNAVEDRRNRSICQLYCDVLDCAGDRPSRFLGRFCDRLGSMFEARAGGPLPCEEPADLCAGVVCDAPNASSCVATNTCNPATGICEATFKDDAVMPDLQVYTASVAPIPVLPGENLTVTAVIQNTGCSAARNVRVEGCDASGWCDDGTVPVIDAGERVVVHLPLTAATGHLTGNPHFFVVGVDPQNRIAESDETNNSYHPLKPAFVVALNLVAPRLEEEQDYVFDIENAVPISQTFTSYGIDGAPSSTEPIADPTKGLLDPPRLMLPALPRISPKVASMEVHAAPDDRLRYVVQYRHDVPMPRLPDLPDLTDRFAAINIPVLERSMGMYEAVRRSRIAAANDLMQRVQAGGGEVLEFYTLAGAMLVEAPKGMLAMLDSHPLVQHIDPQSDDSLPPTGTVSLGRERINSDPYYNYAFNSSIRQGYITLLDTGVRKTHVMLQDRIWLAKDCVHGDGNCDDTLGNENYDSGDTSATAGGHGTRTAAVLSGVGLSGTDAHRGVTSATVNSFNVYDGGPSIDAVVRAFDQAAVWGDKIIVAELQANPGNSASIINAADDAFDAGKAVFAANGNYGDDPGDLGSPAVAHKVLGIGNYDVATLAAIHSQSRGPTTDNRIKPDIQAPTNVQTATNQSDFDLGIFTGTSGATPFAAGAGALFHSWLTLTGIAASPGLIYAALINGGPLDWGNSRTGPVPGESPFNNDEGVGKFKLPTNGRVILGCRNVSNSAVHKIVNFTVPAGAEELSAAIWWGETDRVPHRDIDLHVHGPTGDLEESSNSIDSVFEHVIITNPGEGLSYIRISVADIPESATVTVCFAIHIVSARRAS